MKSFIVFFFVAISSVFADLFINSPVLSTIWTVGTQQTIVWVPGAAGILGPLNIYLYRGEGGNAMENILTFATNVDATLGQLTVSVPADLPQSQFYSVGFLESNGLYSYSSYFAINGGSPLTTTSTTTPTTTSTTTAPTTTSTSTSTTTTPTSTTITPTSTSTTSTSTSTSTSSTSTSTSPTSTSTSTSTSSTTSSSTSTSTTPSSTTSSSTSTSTTPSSTSTSASSSVSPSVSASSTRPSASPSVSASTVPATTNTGGASSIIPDKFIAAFAASFALSLFL